MCTNGSKLNPDWAQPVDVEVAKEFEKVTKEFEAGREREIVRLEELCDDCNSAIKSYPRNEIMYRVQTGTGLKGS